MDIKFADKNLLDCLVQFGENTFFLSCIYGEPANDGRSRVWERLSRIGAKKTEPWCLMVTLMRFSVTPKKQEVQEGRKPCSYLLLTC